MGEFIEVVLNAFRHQRLLHRPRRRTIQQPLKCSTPFGIKDYCIWRPPRAQPVLNGNNQTVVDIECSTPFGIKDYCIMRCAHCMSGLSVLNAFRHQRLLHISKRRNAVSVGVYVLNAFRHQRLLHTANRQLPRPHSARGAQRLSASKITASVGDDRAPAGRRSSAQRLSASKITALPRSSTHEAHTLPRVLNAFRHQRLLHSTSVTICF